MKLDSTDKSILQFLANDGRMKFLDIARKLRVVGGTIHARVAKFKREGLIRSYEAQFDFKKMGYDISSFIGISLAKPKDYQRVTEKLKRIPNILEIDYTTGEFSLFIRLLARNIDDFHRILHYEIQEIDGIEATKTMIILDQALYRNCPDPLFF